MKSVLKTTIDIPYFHAKGAYSLMSNPAFRQKVLNKKSEIKKEFEKLINAESRFFRRSILKLKWIKHKSCGVKNKSRLLRH